jgi:hypothetical protein
LTRQAHARDSQCHRFAREVEDGNRRGEKGRYSPYNHLSAENCACSAPPACWQLIGSPRGERLGRPRCIRSLAGTKSMARINVTAGSPGAHPCRRSDDFVRPHRHRHVLSFRTVSLLQSPPWRACTRIAPYSPARRYAVSGTGKCRNSDAAHRAPSAALNCGADDRRSGICETDPATIRNPSLLFPAIRKNARCSLSRENSLQTVESIGKFDSHCTGSRCNF